MMTDLRIELYNDTHEHGVEAVLQSIDTEYAEPYRASPGVKSVHLPDAYWVALLNDKVAGTVGVMRFGKVAVLKRMFLHKDARGNGIADALLKTALGWSREQGLTDIYLGTMSQFIAAQYFYKKNGFLQISEADLPAGFPANPVDTVFFRCEL